MAPGNAGILPAIARDGGVPDCVSPTKEVDRSTLEPGPTAIAKKKGFLPLDYGKERW